MRSRTSLATSAHAAAISSRSPGLIVPSVTWPL